MNSRSCPVAHESDICDEEVGTISFWLGCLVGIDVLLSRIFRRVVGSAPIPTVLQVSTLLAYMVAVSAACLMCFFVWVVMYCLCRRRWLYIFRLIGVVLLFSRWES